MEPPRGTDGIARAMGMLLRPAQTWDVIAEAPADERALFVRYAVRHAAAPAICGVVGALAFGFNIASIDVRMSLWGVLLGAVVGYGLMLAAMWVLIGAVDRLAPVFGGARSRGAAANLVIYAASAFWIGGLAELYPSLGIPVGILAALYSLYALYLGLSRLMGIPEARRLTAFAAILLVILALAAVRDVLMAKAAELGGPLSATYSPR